MSGSDASAPPIWSRRDSRATAAVAVQFAVNGAFFASLFPRLPELRDQIEVSTEAIGVLLTVSAASGVVASLTSARLIARFSTRTVMFAGGVVIGLALVGVGVSSTWAAAALALAVMFAVDVYVDVAMNMQASWLSARRARSIMSRVHGLWSLGSVLGGLGAGALAGAAVSLRAHLIGAAVILVVVSSVLATQLLPVDEVHRHDEADPPLDPNDASRPGRSGSAAVRDRTARSLMARFFLAGLAAVVIEVAAMNWAAFRITDDLGGAESTGAIAFAAVMAGGTLSRFLGDHLAHRFGAERFTSVSAVVAMVGLVAAAVVGTPALVVTAFLVAGLGTAALTPRLYDLAARAGGGTASGLGWLTAGMRIANMVTPVAVAAMATGTSVGTAIAIAGVAAGLLFIGATANPDAFRARARLGPPHP